jgi:hypothetical protein
MKRKLCIKRLTASDLTLFEWHFRNRNAGNQKSINLNSDVFVGHLYPALPDIARQQGGKLSLDLFIAGPGGAAELNLQRKIVKTGSYKNWRLNGEFIHNPPDSPERYNCLRENDFAVMEFRGDVFPDTARIVLLAKEHEADRALVDKLNEIVTKMVALDREDLANIIEAAQPSPDHPIHEFLIEGDLEDAALGGAVGTRRLLARRSGRLMSREALAAARESAEEIGSIGEEMIDAYLAEQKRNGVIRDYEWTSMANAIAPFDFLITAADGVPTHVDVKSTSGGFERPLHISFAEVAEMAHTEIAYRIFRVFGISAGGATLRVSEPLQEFAADLMSRFHCMPDGIVIDSISASPARLSFGPPVDLSIPDFDVPPDETS